MLAYSGMNRPDDAFPILRFTLEQQNPNPEGPKRQGVLSEVVSDI